MTWYGAHELILNAGRDISGGPVTTVTDASSRISRLVGEVGAVKIGVAAALVLLVSVLAAAAVGRRRQPRGDLSGRTGDDGPGPAVPATAEAAGTSTIPVEASH